MGVYSMVWRSAHISTIWQKGSVGVNALFSFADRLHFHRHETGESHIPMPLRTTSHFLCSLTLGTETRLALNFVASSIQGFEKRTTHRCSQNPSKILTAELFLPSPSETSSAPMLDPPTLEPEPYICRVLSHDHCRRMSLRRACPALGVVGSSPC